MCEEDTGPINHELAPEDDSSLIGTNIFGFDLTTSLEEDNFMESCYHIDEESNQENAQLAIRPRNEWEDAHSLAEVLYDEQQLYREDGK